SIYVPAWIDGEFVENALELVVRTSVRNSVAEAPTTNDVAEAIAQQLGTLIPPGGRLWFAYEAFDGEGALMRETRAALKARVPLLTTPIGYLLYCADCWIGLRDWDIPEGGREGPRKLQGNKALNAEQTRQRAREIVPVLEQFALRAGGEIERRAAARAQVMLPALRSMAGAT
ncbi:MAG: DUF1122 family protein, partial [Chloroflexota bacterium]|nr:DUF1122 family protein [Chloroflexota bacterium]